MDPNQYKCHFCGGIFDKGQSDESALNESISTFGDQVLDPDIILATICDDCYREFMEQRKKSIS
jgi:hypothetical protein